MLNRPGMDNADANYGGFDENKENKEMNMDVFTTDKTNKLNEFPEKDALPAFSTMTADKPSEEVKELKPLIEDSKVLPEDLSQRKSEESPRIDDIEIKPIETAELDKAKTDSPLRSPEEPAQNQGSIENKPSEDKAGKVEQEITEKESKGKKGRKKGNVDEEKPARKLRQKKITSEKETLDVGHERSHSTRDRKKVGKEEYEKYSEMLNKKTTRKKGK